MKILSGNSLKKELNRIGYLKLKSPEIFCQKWLTFRMELECKYNIRPNMNYDYLIEYLPIEGLKEFYNFMIDKI